MITKKRRFLFAVILAFMVGSFALCYAEETPATIYFEAQTPDENGVFDVVLSLENADFILYQLAFSYNKDVVVPVNAKGEVAGEFSDFATRKYFAGISSAGEKLDTEKGLFLFTQFYLSGGNAPHANGKEARFTDKTEFYRFKFKKISDGDYGFKVADIYSGGVYDEFFPEGAVISLSYTKPRITAEVVVKYGETEKRTTSQKYYYSELYPKTFTKEQRLLGTVYLKNDDYAAVASGVLRAVDKDNKSVKPYAKNGENYIPLRFVCESLGYTVIWDDETKSVILEKGDIKKTLSTENNSGVEIVHSRTMVTFDILKELIGVRIYNVSEKEYIIYDAIPEWTPERDAEKAAMEAINYVMIPFFKAFI